VRFEFVKAGTVSVVYIIFALLKNKIYATIITILAPACLSKFIISCVRMYYRNSKNY